MSSSGDKSQNGRHNKLYRTPPSPPPEEIVEKEKAFTLDCVAVSRISTDYSKTNPKLGTVVPPYNSQKDKHVKGYFRFHGVDKTLEKTEQVPPGDSIDGPVMDAFHNSGYGRNYLEKRNQFGAGHSREKVEGHEKYMEPQTDIIGYNGPYGYRRNTPWLRSKPSPFGMDKNSPTHDDPTQYEGYYNDSPSQ